MNVNRCQFRVIGIVQSCINGAWFERTVNDGVFATGPQEAAARVLRRYDRAALHQDKLAIVRWHSPDLVQTILV